MNIQYNEVTWYSKLAAGILFIILLPALSFYIGKEYGEVKALVDSPAYVSKEPQKITIVSAPARVSTENVKYFQATTPLSNAAGNYSNIVGYFAHGNFFFYVPQWIPDHWKITDLPNGGMQFSLKENIPERDFSDILISLSTSTENLNAETLFSGDTSNRDKALCISDTRCEVRESDSSIILSEILLSRVGETRIYHITEETPDGMIKDRFYIDGKKLTAIITFSASKETYNLYENAIRDFVQGIGKGEGAQG